MIGINGIAVYSTAGGKYMIHGLSEYEKYRVLRRVIGEHQLDNTYNMPIILNTFDKYFDWEKV